MILTNEIKKIFIGLCVFALSASSYLCAQQEFIPYFGKNSVKFDTFHWKIYKTEHFDIYFYPKEEMHLEMVASIAEDAYTKIKEDLQHDTSFKIPLIFFLTQSEFEQANYLQVSEGILGVSEPYYNRMAFALDQPPDKLKKLITHELTHIFEFSLLFGSINIQLIKTSPPLWVMEGYAEFETGSWDTFDLTVVRDAILTDNMPYISTANDIEYSEGKDIARAPYTIGHAVWDYIDSKYGKAGIRQLWFQAKKSGYLGEQDLIKNAFGISEDKFNEDLSEWLKNKFVAWKEKQTPIDYGKLLKMEKPYEQILTAAPSPDGKKIAIFTVNKKDQELDLVVISSEDGKIIKNLTPGYTTKFEYLTYDEYDFSGRNISWSKDGKLIAYFARSGKRRNIYIIDAGSGHLKKRIHITLDMAGSPAFSPDNKYLAFTAFSKGISDIYLVNIATKQITNITKDIYYDKTPAWSAKGDKILYASRREGLDQIFDISIKNPAERTQYTSEKYNSSSPWYSQDNKVIYFSSDKNGIDNIYALNLEKNEISQLTDVLGANFSPFTFVKDNQEKLAFTAFFKGKYQLLEVDKQEPVATIAASQPKSTTSEETANNEELAIPLSKDKILKITPGNARDKGFKAVLASRPQVMSGVTNGSFAIASSVAIEDILGDQQFIFYIQRIYGYETYMVTYVDLGHRFQFAPTFIRYNDFFIAPVNDRYNDIAEIKYTGGEFASVFPLNIWSRLEFITSFIKFSEKFYDPISQSDYETFIRDNNIPPYLFNGYEIPLSIAYVKETTRFQYWGPLSGYTFKIGVEYSPKFSNKFLTFTSLFGEFREYFRLTERSLIAARIRAFDAYGKNRMLSYYGGGNDFRGFDFRGIVGDRGALFNSEYRFPLAPKRWLKVPAIGVMRGRVFFEAGITNIKGLPENTLEVAPDLFLDKGFGTVGAGFTVFLGGLPFNFDFSKVHNFHKFVGGIHFDFSIGYEF